MMKDLAESATDTVLTGIVKVGTAHPTDAVLTGMVKIIVEVAQPVKVILFGSRAKDTARIDSDYDFLIIDAEPFGKGRSRRKLVGKVGRALAAFRVPSDILMYSVSEVDHWRQSPNHVIFQAFKEGKILYERSASINQREQPLRLCLTPVFPLRENFPL